MTNARETPNTKIAIVVPTYGPHLPLNVRFLESVERFESTSRPVPVYFFTSTEDEKAALDRAVSQMSETTRARTRVVCLAERLRPLDQPDFLGADEDSGFRFGAIGLITFKKFLGLAHVFAQGFDEAVILDSEVILFRTGDLDRSLRWGTRTAEYRVSLTAALDPFVAAVQHDSIRTIRPAYDSSEYFARAFGWYDNLCAFERKAFAKFIQFLAGSSTGDPILAATRRFRRNAFDWIVYRAWLRFEEQSPVQLVDIDQVLKRQGVQPMRRPQLENIYRCFTADVNANAALIRAMDPPWVPYTENALLRRALEKGLDPRCCLMFHTDRRHFGWHREWRWYERALGKFKRILTGWLNRIEY